MEIYIEKVPAELILPPLTLLVISRPSLANEPFLNWHFLLL